MLLLTSQSWTICEDWLAWLTAVIEIMQKLSAFDRKLLLLVFWLSKKFTLLSMQFQGRQFFNSIKIYIIFLFILYIFFILFYIVILKFAAFRKYANYHRNFAIWAVLTVYQMIWQQNKSRWLILKLHCKAILPRLVLGQAYLRQRFVRPVRLLWQAERHVINIRPGGNKTFQLLQLAVIENLITELRMVVRNWGYSLNYLTFGFAEIRYHV